VNEPLKVTFGAVYGSSIDSWYFNSVVDLLMKPPPPGYAWANASVGVRSGPVLAAGRGHLIGNFREHTDGDVLAMIDTDQSFSPEKFWGLVAAYQSLKEQHPDTGIVAGVTWMSGHPKLENPLPNFWYQESTRGQFIHASTYPENAIVEAAAVGCSNLIIGRDCVDRVIHTEVGRQYNPFHHMPILKWDLLARDIAAWDDPEKIEKALRSAVLEADQLGEDLSFCVRVRDAGFRILVHTGLEFGHSKNYLLDGDDYRTAVARWQAEHPAPVAADQEPVTV
jgi:hypothetical protein